MLAQRCNGLTTRRSCRRDVVVTYLGFALTVWATVMFSRYCLGLIAQISAHDPGAAVEHAFFLGLVYCLVYGSLVHMVVRLGRFSRERELVTTSGTEPESMTGDGSVSDTLLILVPSYKEDPWVVQCALMSAALQEYERRRVVLLIDDPPDPSAVADREALAAIRELPANLSARLAAPARKMRMAQSRYQARAREPGFDARAEIARLAQLHAQAARWFAAEATLSGGDDPLRSFYKENVLLRRFRHHERRSNELPHSIRRTCLPLEDAIAAEYRRLASLFAVEMAGFERKRYVNLSHEPNKAMNLNSYLGLLGHSFHEVSASDGVHLEEIESTNATLVIPPAEYVITLDADSQLLSDYAPRLIHHLCRAGNERIAVVQTPYNTYPGARGLLERAAGATTDVQYLIHQGLTRFDATFWVGANALLRMSALEEIRVVQSERGHPIVRFIQDRTVIEDTESTIDLIHSGWKLYNYPARLSYSATPPDFGSLIIQRRRWANGGLLLLAKLVRYLVQKRWDRNTLMEAMLRFHYLASIALVNASVLCMLVYPFESSLRSPWLLAIAAPYFYVYGRDLVQAGYRWRDLPRVYALNLMLVPVCLGGVAKSFYQAASRKKAAFGRTPKVPGRTPAPALYILLEVGILGYLLAGSIIDLEARRFIHATMGFASAAFFVYVVVWLMGVRESLSDLRLRLHPRRVAPDPRPKDGELATRSG